MKDALEAFLGEEIRALEPVGEGQSNPTYRFELASGTYALRKQPDGEILPSAHAVDREYRVMAALAGSDVPVPSMIRLVEDKAIIGTKFFLMDWIDGRVSNDSTLPILDRSDRSAAYSSAAKALAALHQLDWRAAGLTDFGRAQGFFARQIARWSKQWALSKTREDAHIDALAAWLAANIPNDDHAGITHGDYRIGNLMYKPAKPVVAAVLDWELSTIGHPMADVAHFCCFWDLDHDQLGGLADVDLTALGLPTRDAFLSEYRAHGGLDAELTPFHRAFALFRFAVIFEGITARAKAGQALGATAQAVGALAPVVAERAHQIMTGERA